MSDKNPVYSQDDIMKIIVSVALLSTLLVLACSSPSVQGDGESNSEKLAKQALDKMYSMIQSQKLLEEQPFHNPFKLEVPTDKEKTGVLLKNLKQKLIVAEGKLTGISIVAAVGAQNDIWSKIVTKTTLNGTIRISLNRKPNELDYMSIVKGVGKRIENGIESPLFSFDHKTEFKGKLSLDSDTEIKVDSYAESIETLQNYLGKVESDVQIYNGAGNLFLRDIDSDNIKGVFVTDHGFNSLPAFPGKAVKAGDQWEYQVYVISSITSYGMYGNTHPSSGYVIQLYTFELAGFSTVAGRRCAIIEYMMEQYGMGQGQLVKTADKEEIKRIAKTLSKSKLSEIRSYINSMNPLSFYNAHAAQSVIKHYGILALDYKTGMIVELHEGYQTIRGLGVKVEMNTSAIYSFSKAQTIYKADIK